MTTAEYLQLKSLIKKQNNSKIFFAVFGFFVSMMNLVFFAFLDFFVFYPIGICLGAILFLFSMISYSISIFKKETKLEELYEGNTDFDTASKELVLLHDKK